MPDQGDLTTLQHEHPAVDQTVWGYVVTRVRECSDPSAAYVDFNDDGNGGTVNQPTTTICIDAAEVGLFGIGDSFLLSYLELHTIDDPTIP